MSKRTKQLLNENNALENCIQNPENKEVLTNMVVYIRAANISPYDQEKVRRDMTEMILDGEHRGAPIKDVIGEDYRLFCDDVIAEIPKLTGRTRIPVSYTHLDVYKRQALGHADHMLSSPAHLSTLLHELLLGSLALGAKIRGGIPLVNITANRANKLFHFSISSCTF